MNANQLFTLVGTIAIDASGAASVIDATVTKAGAAADALNNAGKAGNDFGKSIGSNSKLGAGSVWLGNMLTKVSAAAYNFGKRMISSGFDYNASMETYTKSFATYMGNDMDLAEEFMGKLHEMAKETPLNLTNLAEGAKRLLGVGVAADDTLETLRMWGDVSLGNSENFSRLVLANSQIISLDRLMSEELNQLSDAGFPVWKIMPEFMGLDSSAFREQVEKGKVNPEDLTELLKYVVSPETGLYYGGMEKQMESYAGQTEKLSDIIAQAQGALTKPFFDEAASNVMPKITTLLEDFYKWCVDNKEALTELATSVGDVVVNVMTALIDGLKWITENKDAANAALLLVAGGFTAISIAVNPLHGIFLALGEVALLCITNWDKIKGTWENITSAIDEAIIALQRFFGINSGSTTHTFEGENGNVLMGGGGAQFGLINPYEGFVGDLSQNITSAMQGVPGAATGLDRVPYDNYLVRLHKDEAVLNATNAAAWRSGGMGNLEAKMDSMIALLQQLTGFNGQIVANTGRGQSIVLDSGALVGNLLPAIDEGLGTRAARTRRLNNDFYSRR